VIPPFGRLPSFDRTPETREIRDLRCPGTIRMVVVVAGKAEAAVAAAGEAVAPGAKVAANPPISKKF